MGEPETERGDPRPRWQARSIPDLVDGTRRGDIRSLARLLTVLEGNWEAGAGEAMRLLTPHAGRAHVVGVTGPPGVGKSTLVDRLVTALREAPAAPRPTLRAGTPVLGDPRCARVPRCSGEQRQALGPAEHRAPSTEHASTASHRVAVLAFDPSSPFTGGALLGDRIRMGGRALDPGVYIRSVANRVHAGGLSRTAARLVTALDAAGYGTILLETVGAGQSEVEVSALAHTVLVVLAPGFGDEIQALKAGILETADLYVVNKADLPGADRVAATLRAEAAYRGEGLKGMGEVQGARGEVGQGDLSGPPSPLAPRPCLLVSAETGAGIPELVAAIRDRDEARDGMEGEERRRRRVRWLLEEATRDALWQRYWQRQRGALAEMAERVLAGETDPESAAHRLIDGDPHDGEPDS